MFNSTKLIIDAFVEELKVSYNRTYGLLEPEYPNIIAFTGRLALESIANSDAPYHDLNHTILVADVGQAVLRGKQIAEGGVTPKDWMEFTISLLCHDIGYVRGVCRKDRPGAYVINDQNETVAVNPGGTDASLTPYHVNRGKIFIRERFGKVPQIDVDTIISNIEYTRFPVPASDAYANIANYPGLVRSADLIGQLADINYLRKIHLLYQEFEETGINSNLGYKNSDDLRHAYPRFFWKTVAPFIQEGLRYLRITQEGKQWVANLYANVFEEEHHGSLVER